MNVFAKEYYLEANSGWLSKETPDVASKVLSALNLNITEMNLAGSIDLETLNKNNSMTNWRTGSSPVNMI